MLGYSTGKSSTLSEKQRREILDIAFTARLPVVNNEEYTKSWGPPRSKQRLEKIAEAITTFTRIQGSRPGWEQAVEERRDDYTWLRKTYGHIVGEGFRWPQSYS